MARIVIHNKYKWLLDPRFGRFTAYVDGRKAGRIDLNEKLELPISANQEHVVRVRLWWYLSPRLRLVLHEGETRQLYANVRRNLKPLQAVLMAFRPFAALSLGDGTN
jgi:hypothetical protein